MGRRSMGRRMAGFMHFWVVPGGDRDNNINQHTEPAFKVVGLAIPQEISDHKNRQDNGDYHEDLKIQTHVLSEAPANDYHQRCIQEGGLDRWAKAMEQGEVDLVIPIP